jgi:hypothetical protein
MSFRVEVKGMREVIDLLDRMDPKDRKKIVSKATADAAKKILAPKVKAATPWARMKAAVRARQVKKDKPGGIVLYDSKKAWFRHFLIGGTRAHTVRPKRASVMAFDAGGTQGFSRGHEVRGLRSNPVISRVADQYGDDALEHVERFLVREFGLEE